MLTEPNQRTPVLFVDDEADIIDTFVNNFEDVFDVLTATSGPKALEVLRSREPAVMVTDQRMPGMHGLEVIRRGLEIRPDLVPIILTGFTDDRDLIEAINLQRIYRYIPKPWNPEDLRHSIDGAIQKHKLVLENRRLTSQLQKANERLRVENAYLKAETPRTLVGEAPAMQRLLDEIARVATKTVTVLIEGETGTGKELVARSIHGGSTRRERVFVAVNCAEVSADAAESSLFGHRKGSFTGAFDDHKGFFEVADKGTLFLDEVGELNLQVQAKLLRVLQEGEIVRFGESRPRNVDVRLIAATNRSLDKEVEAGRFRADLLYRLNVVPIRVPPLRERREDIRRLVEHFVVVHAKKLGVPLPEIEAEAMRALVAYDFPGNIRDLENTIIRAMVLAEPGDVIGLADLPAIPAVRAATAGPSGLASGLPEAVTTDPTGGTPAQDRQETLLASVARYERGQIEQALRASDGNRARAARALGISRRWLLRKLERYGVEMSGTDADDKE